MTCITLFHAGDGRLRLLSGSDDATVRLWEPSTGDELALLGGHTGPVVFVGKASDRASAPIISASLDDTIRLWRAPGTSRRPRGIGHQGAVTSAAMSADGRHAVTGGEDGAAIFWDFAVELPVWSSAGYRVAVRAVALDAASTTVAIGLVDGTGVLWDVKHSSEAASGPWVNPVSDGMGFVVDGPAGRLRLAMRRRLLGGTQWTGEPADAVAVGRRRTVAEADGVLLRIGECRFPCAARVTAVDGDDRFGRAICGDERGNVYLLQRVDPGD